MYLEFITFELSESTRLIPIWLVYKSLPTCHIAKATGAKD